MGKRKEQKITTKMENQTEENERKERERGERMNARENPAVDGGEVCFNSWKKTTGGEV